jgi:uncharacterized metal-binding protein
LDCAECKSKKCTKPNSDKLFEDCTTEKNKEILLKCTKKYEIENIKNIYKTAVEIESEGYMKWPRLKEIIEFSKKLGFKKIGIAFCVGLSEEAKKVTEVLRKKGFDVYPVLCKVGSIPKNELGVPSLRGDPSLEAGCNPIGQAEILNNYKTDLNLIIGLCVGHDIIFTKISKAPVTTFIVKDRVLAHNTAAVLYTSYYEKML